MMMIHGVGASATLLGEGSNVSLARAGRVSGYDVAGLFCALFIFYRCVDFLLGMISTNFMQQ